MTERDGAQTWLAGMNGFGGAYNYELALAVAYGVHFGYLRDTSYGAAGFRHRNEVNPFINEYQPDRSYVCGVATFMGSDGLPYAVDKKPGSGDTNWKGKTRFTATGDGPAFFLRMTYDTQGRPEEGGAGITSQELAAWGRYPARDPRPNEWKTGFLPKGCGYFTP